MDDMIGVIVALVVVFALSTIGVRHLVMDFRHFNEITEQCEEQGYIQNKTVRIKCQKEAP